MTRTRESRRKETLKRRYKLDIAVYNSIYDYQEGRCAICATPKELYPKNPRDGLWVDHDHSCCDTEFTCGKCVRGLLCSKCNSMIGLHKDSVDILHRAVDYLTIGGTVNAG